MATFKALDESRRLTLPKSADEYKAQLPSDFQAPQGVEYKIDDKSPLMAQARSLMHDIDTGKLSGQAAFEKMLALHAANQISTVETLRVARDAEVAKLGATGPARVNAAQQFLNAQLGDELGKIVGNMMVTARHVEGFEKLMASFRSQGAGSFSQSHRSPNEPARVSDAEYEKMSYSQQKEYAAQFNGHRAA